MNFSFNYTFDIFLHKYLNRFPNTDIISEIVDVITKDISKKDNKIIYHRIIKLYNKTPKLLKKFGFDISSGEILEKITVDFENKIIISELINNTLTEYIKGYEKNYICEKDNKIYMESVWKCNSSIPFATKIATQKYKIFKKCENQILNIV
jgi:hypothetical protein